MVGFGTSSAFRGWVRVRVLGYGFGVRGRKVKSQTDCALASDLVRAAYSLACRVQRGPLDVCVLLKANRSISTKGRNVTQRLFCIYI